MVPRKDVYGMLLGPLVALGGLGCATMPLPLATENPKPQAPVPSVSGGPPPIVTTAAAPASIPSDPAVKLHALYREAAERYARVDSYIVRLMRREQINGKDKPEEVLLFKFRKEPWSVYFKWLGQEGAGREVIYVKGQHENKIHTLLAAGDMPLMPAGRRIALAPDSLVVRS